MLLVPDACDRTGGHVGSRYDLTKPNARGTSVCWNTPIAWTGFILFADGIVWRARGDSWIRSAPREFVFLALASIPLWLVFEFYNRFIDNWYYVGLPTNTLLRYFGYAWSFATIWPAIFEGAELIAVWRGLPTPTARPSPSAPPALPSFPSLCPSALSIIAGGAMLAWPNRPSPISRRRLARIHLSSRADQRAPRRGVAVLGLVGATCRAFTT